MPDHAPVPVFRGVSENGKLKLDQREKFAALIQRLDGKEICVTLKQFRRKRSTAANAYYWSLVTLFAEHIGEDDPEDVHNGLKSKFLCKHESGDLMIIGSTTKLDTAEFAEYLSKFKRMALEYGCRLPEPDEFE